MALLICPPVSKRSHLSTERSHHHWSSSVGSSKEQQLKWSSVSEHFIPSIYQPVTRRERERKREHNANTKTKPLHEGILKHKGDVQKPEPHRIVGSPRSLSDPGSLPSESVVQSTPRPSLPTFLENESFESNEYIQIDSSSEESSLTSFEDSHKYLASSLFLDVEEDFKTDHLNVNKKEDESVKHCNYMYVNLDKETEIKRYNSSLDTNDDGSGQGSRLELSPMIKEELKLKIQLRRLSEGKPELPFIHLGPKNTTYQLSEDEIQRRERRMQRNRQAAKEHRKKKQHRDTELKKAVNKQIEEHTKLQREVATLLKRRDRLKHLLDNHMETCTRVKL